MAGVLESPELWRLIEQLNESTPVEEIMEFAARPSQAAVSMPWLPARVHAGLEEGIRYLAKTTEIVIELRGRLESAHSSHEEVMETGLKEPMAFMRAEIHPALKRVILDQHLAQVALFALGSSERHTYSEDVLDELATLWVSGERKYLALVASAAVELDLSLEEFDLRDLLPEGPLDTKTLTQEFDEMAIARAQALDEARSTDARVYPPIEPDDGS
ncbi:MAG: hypothetical protein IPM35_34635 [Myxococcales bacterium]|nr:hypothetical protein [Myxococcales bacterium]